MKTFTSLTNEAKSPPFFISSAGASSLAKRLHFFISPLAGDFIFGAAKIMQNTSLSRRAERRSFLLIIVIRREKYGKIRRIYKKFIKKFPQTIAKK